MSLWRPQIAQPMLTVAYRPAASQMVCRVGRQTLGHGSIVCMLHCIKALRSDVVKVSDLFMYFAFLKVKGVASYQMLTCAILLNGLVTKIDRYNIWALEIRSPHAHDHKRVEPGHFPGLLWTFIHFFLDLIVATWYQNNDNMHQTLKTIYWNRIDVRWRNSTYKPLTSFSFCESTMTFFFWKNLTTCFLEQGFQEP